MKTAKQELQQLKDKTFILTLILKKEDVDLTYQKVLKSVQADYESKGFRKGKVPLDIVKSGIDETKIIEEVLTTLISDAYTHKVKEYNLHPIIQPLVKVLNPPIIFGKDWEVEINGCELPQTTLDPKYKDEIKTINQTKENDNEKLNKTIEILVKNSKVDIPEILIKADIDNKLSQLIDQTAQAGLTVNQYLKSKNQTLEQYQNNLNIQVKTEWITNLAIDQIARDHKLEVTDTEAQQLISKNKQFSNNPNLVYYLLTQQKVFEFLKNL
jgi:FKBP-type peptidyl-prolyl cis-trans isomerase (trigger factor)